MKTDKSDTTPTVRARKLTSLSPLTLKSHPKNARIFNPPSPEKKAALRNNIRDNGIQHPLVACGENCASAPSTILRGDSRCTIAVELELEEVPVIVVDGLTADEETLELILGNLADQHARELSEEEKFRCEEELRGVMDRRPGQRTDIDDTAVPGTTNELIAKQTGESSASVRDRKLIYTSQFATPALHQAVAQKKMARTAAAGLLREAEKGGNGGMSVDQVRGMLDDLVAERVSTTGVPKEKKLATQGASDATATSPAAAEAPSPATSTNSTTTAEDAMIDASVPPPTTTPSTPVPLNMHDGIKLAHATAIRVAEQLAAAVAAGLPPSLRFPATLQEVRHVRAEAGAAIPTQLWDAAAGAEQLVDLIGECDGALEQAGDPETLTGPQCRPQAKTIFGKAVTVSCAETLFHGPRTASTRASGPVSCAETLFRDWRPSAEVQPFPDVADRTQEASPDAPEPSLSDEEEDLPIEGEEPPSPE